MKLLLRPALLALALLAAPGLAPAQTTVKKVVLQGFWWDYRNNNYPARWADYLTDLAPRLKELGIDAVWVPPFSKNNGGTNGVGYAPFDHYDLGDKYQKGTTRTRVGTKDELLRLVAALHANGIEVVEDVVLNHVDGAGTSNGAGGIDPNPMALSANAGYKNFRNACWATPVPEAADNAAAYLARRGRWPKNYPNFHAHGGHNSTSGDYAQPAFGPDFCFGDDGGSDGYGLSSNASYNPAQGAGYSRTEARNWLVWMKKQTGVDGVRWDAVKNYGYAPQQDWVYNLKYLAGFASGGEAMLNTGEYVGGGAQLDGYCQAVNGRNGGQDFAMGTFDFGLRGGLYGLVSGNGSYDLGQIPATQQNQRVAYYSGSNTYVHRTAPWVNSHDSFRPQLSATGTYAGWNTADELVPHIVPSDVRLSAAYAVALAVDGNPHIFLEDLFDLGNGQRFSHLPTDRAALPVRSDLANLIWCHQRLRFKDGAYAVRWQSPDHLVIERAGRALIGINDQFSTWQNHTVSSAFAPGTVLKDYSGANGTATVTVGAGGQVAINTPPCNGTAAQGRRGYSVWAPVGQDNATYSPGRAARTVQEWELADDLGDSNCRGLGQGGALPANSQAWRTAGRIYARAGQVVNFNLYAENNATNTLPLEVGVFDGAGNALRTATGTRSLTGTLTPAADAWLTLKARNGSATQAGQRVYLQVSYEAPPVLDTRNPAQSPVPTTAVWTGAAGTPNALDCRNYEGNVLPAPLTDVRIPAGTPVQPVVPAGEFFFARHLTIEAGASLTAPRGTTVQLFGNLSSQGSVAGDGLWHLSGLARTPQRLASSTPLTLARVLIANDSADVALDADLTVRDTLELRSGHLALGPHALRVGRGLLGGSPASYVLTSDGPGGGFCHRFATAAAPVLYPVGTAAGYAPFTFTSQSSFPPGFDGVRAVSGILSDVTSGPPLPAAARFVRQAWLVNGVPAPNCCGPGTVALGWEATAEGPAFNRAQAGLFGYTVSTGWTAQTTAPVAATGGGPYEAAFANVPVNRPAFAVGSFGALPARASAAPALLSAYPNPSAGTVRLAAPSAAPLALRLSNTLGQTLLAADPAPLATQQERLNAALAPAAPGVYLLTVQNAAGATQHLRLVVE